MPATKDSVRGTWTSQFYYEDWQGNKKKKKKRGFSTKKEALEYEREFQLSQAKDPDMTFASLYDIYIEDMSTRLRESTINTKRYMIESKILPYFKNRIVSEITPSDIRAWQNTLIKCKQNYSQTYLKSTNNQLSAILNYSVTYCGIKQNPCKIAGSMGKSHADEMDFWTKEEFFAFLEGVSSKPTSVIAFKLLFFTGMRIGELMALCLEDIDFEQKMIHINKSIQRLKGKDIITKPKTPKSIRKVPVPEKLLAEVKDYISTLYSSKPKDRLFLFTKYYLVHEMNRGCKNSSVKHIRLHDLRHSHASLLINLGFSPLIIAERLGHEKIETTLNTYSHLYPHKQTEVVDALTDLF